MEAEDGLEAIDKYEQACAAGAHFDTVLMDYEMPRMNGPTATARLRELGCWCAIIGVTGNVLPADVTFFKRHGADEVLGKPLEFDLLRRTWAMTDITRRPPADAGTGTSSASNGMHPSNSKAAGSEKSGDRPVAPAAVKGDILGTHMSGPGSPAQLRPE